MTKKTLRPLTNVKNPEPRNKLSNDWVIWAAWADRVTFEDIKKETGKNEAEVIKIMRSNLKSSSFSSTPQVKEKAGDELSPSF